MQHFTAAICWALVLFGAAITADEESGLQVNVSKEEIRGTLAIGENQCLEFYSKMEGNYIVSVTTFSNLTSGVRVQLTSLKLPAAVTAIHDRKNEHMLEKVLDAATVTATVFLEEENLPPISNSIVTYCYQFADVLFERTDGPSQLRFSLMYHSAIMGCAKRITDGAQNPNDICSVSPRYYYGDGLFVCIQDLETAMSEESSNRQKRANWPRGRRSPTGRHWGCCGNYGKRCRFWSNLCWWHDCICQCCSRWYCGWACRRERWCNTRNRVRC